MPLINAQLGGTSFLTEEGGMTCITREHTWTVSLIIQTDTQAQALSALFDGVPVSVTLPNTVVLPYTVVLPTAIPPYRPIVVEVTCVALIPVMLP